MVNEFELELETCMVMVFNTTKLLRYEKAHSLRSLVSAARVKTRSMVISIGNSMISSDIWHKYHK